MKFRKLRIAWSLVWGVVAVLVVVLWVRSYARVDDIKGAVASLVFSVESGRASLAARLWTVPSSRGGLSFNANSRLNNNIKGYDADLIALTDKLGFGFSRYLIIPHWFAVSIAVAFIAIPWLRWTKRFTLRTLFIVTTLVAIVLGLIVWTAR